MAAIDLSSAAHFFEHLSGWSLRAAILVYTAACAIVVPTAAEAVLLVHPRLSYPDIILVASVGKTIGICVIGYLALGAHTLLDRFAPYRRVIALSSWWEPWLLKYGFLCYVVIQAVPPLPMRSSAYAYAHLTRSMGRVMIGAAAGTCVRTALFLITGRGVQFLLGH